MILPSGASTNPLDWGNVQRHGSILQMYRDLIRVRRNWLSNTAGLRGDRVNVFHVNDDDKLMAFHRFASSK
jgi:1,4-alpha-glucan branching enzyme